MAGKILDGISTDTSPQEHVTSDQQDPKLHITEKTADALGEYGKGLLEFTKITEDLVIVSTNDFVNYLYEEHKNDIIPQVTDRYEIPDGLTSQEAVDRFIVKAFFEDIEHIVDSAANYKSEFQTKTEPHVKLSDLEDGISYQEIVHDFFAKAYPDFDYNNFIEQNHKNSGYPDDTLHYSQEAESELIIKRLTATSAAAYMMAADGDPETPGTKAFLFTGSLGDHFDPQAYIGDLIGVSKEYVRDNLNVDPGKIYISSVAHEAAHIANSDNERKFNQDEHGVPRRYVLEKEVMADTGRAEFLNKFDATDEDVYATHHFLNVMDKIRTASIIDAGYDYTGREYFHSHATGVIEYGLEKKEGKDSITAEFNKAAIDDHARIGAEVNFISHYILGILNNLGLEGSLRSVASAGRKLSIENPELRVLVIEKMLEEGYFPDGIEKQTIQDFVDSFRDLVKPELFETEQALELKEKLKSLDIEESGFSKVDRIDKESFLQKRGENASERRLDHYDEVSKFQESVTETVHVKM